MAMLSAYWFGSTKLMFLLGLVLLCWLMLRTVFFHDKVKPVDSAMPCMASYTSAADF